MPDFSTYTDEQLLSLCAWREARGEVLTCGDIAVLAVMHVIVNREQDWKWSLRHVILGPNQFSSFNANDPEYNLLPSPDDPTYIHCLADASAILNGTDPDETCRAHWYANLLNIDKGGWFDRHIVSCPGLHPLTVKIGHHSFFR